mmetsp:Transcript_142897/g.456504  ORF Transcript_142897/g.456504 Transcript_142897/m.456504 type:complete len:361 (-) Transcript_142897:8-1090(-)
MVKRSNCFSLHCCNILSGSYATPLTQMILSPISTAFSGKAPPLHCRFQASTAPSARIPSTTSTFAASPLVASRCDTLRPRSVASAFLIVKLKVTSAGVGGSEVASESATGIPGGACRCCGSGVAASTDGVTCHNASTRDSGAAPDSDGNGNGGTGGSGSSLAVAVSPASTAAKGSEEDPPVFKGDVSSPPVLGVLVTAEPAQGEAVQAAPAAAALRRGASSLSREVRVDMTCLNCALSCSSCSCLSKHLETSAESLSALSCCRFWTTPSIWVPFCMSSSSFSPTLASTAFKTSRLTASIVAARCMPTSRPGGAGKGSSRLLPQFVDGKAICAISPMTTEHTRPFPWLGNGTAVMTSGKPT